MDGGRQMPPLQLTHVSIDRTLTAEKSAHKIRILVPGHEMAEVIYRPGLLSDTPRHGVKNICLL